MPNAVGIHYEVSRPTYNPIDGYYYQRVRQVDGNGVVVGASGDYSVRSNTVGQTDGLYLPSLNINNLGQLTLDVLKLAVGIFTESPTTVNLSVFDIVRILNGDGLQNPFSEWFGTDKPWENPGSAVFNPQDSNNWVADPNGFTFRSYDSDGRPTGSFSLFDDGSFVQTINDTDGSRRISAYDQDGRLVTSQQINTDGSMTVTGYNEKGEPVWTYGRDANGNTSKSPTDGHGPGGGGGTGGNTGGDGNGGMGGDGGYSGGKDSGGGVDRPLPNQHDPLIVNLNGLDLNLTPLANSNAHFDFDGQGFATRTAWIASGEGLLIKDNGSGDDNVTPDELLGAVSGNGFQDLAPLDGNGDGTITIADSAFGSLRLWVDANLDGHVDSGELKTMADVGISSISLNNSVVNQNVAGNQVVERADTTINGQSRAIFEVNFQTSAIETIYTPPAGFSYAADALKLPELPGYGRLASLHVAMSQNASLLNDVKSLVLNSGTATGASLDATFEAVLLKWANVSDIDPSSRGPNVDARHLAFVYALYGINEATQPIYAGNPDARRGPQWEDTYRYLVDHLEIRFASQVGFSLFQNGVSVEALTQNALTVFSEIGFNPSTDTITVSQNSLFNSIVRNAPTDSLQAQAYYDRVFHVMKGLRADFFGEDKSTFAASALSRLGALGVDITLQKIVANALNFQSVDLSGTTGSVDAGLSSAVIFFGVGSKTVSSRPDDVFVYSATSGNDVITGAAGSAKLSLAGFAVGQLEFERPNGGSDLIIKNLATDSTLTVSGYFNGNSFKEVALANGNLISATDMPEAIRKDAIRYLTLASSASDTPAEKAARLALFGLSSIVNGNAANVAGTANSDVIFAGSGDETLVGMGGADIYVYSPSSGNVTVNDASNKASDVVLNSIRSGDVTVSRPANSFDLVITVGLTGKTLTIAGDFANSALNTVTFADGVVWGLDFIKQKLLDQQSATNGGSVYGYWGDDTIVAGLGNKYLNGEGGHDTYVYTSAGGNDEIADPGNQQSVLKLTDISSTGITLSRLNGSVDLLLTVVSTGRTINIHGMFGNGGQLASIQFSDNVTWTYEQIKQKLLDQQTSAIGGSVYGYWGDDTIDAGAGNKYLNGQGGYDTYVYSSLGGNDIISDPNNFLSTLKFADIASTDVTLARPNNGDDLVITNTLTGKTVTVEREFANGGPLRAITFSDGVAWRQADVLSILAGGTASGNGTAFLFSRGDGQKSVDKNYYDSIRLGPNINASDLLFQGNSYGDLKIFLRNSSDAITIGNDLSQKPWGTSSAIDRILFNNGATLLLGQQSADVGVPLTFTWLANSNSYNLYGSNFGANIFEVTTSGSINFGNTGSGGSGINTIKFAKNSGVADVQPNGGTGIISFGTGVSAQDVYLQANSYGDLIVKIHGDATDGIVVHNDLTNVSGTIRSAINQLQFADGSQVNLGQPLTFNWLGNSNGYYLSGSTYGVNVYDITVGSGSIGFGNFSSGSNVINFAKNTGTADVQTNGGTGSIVFGAGVSGSDVYLQANSYGDLIFKLRGDAIDGIFVHNALTTVSGKVKNAINQYQLSDGSKVNLTQPLTFTWFGASNNYSLLGSNFGSNVFEITAGNGTVNFGNSSSGGPGTNTVKYSRGTGHLDVYLNGGSGVIEMGSGIGSGDLFVQSNSYGDLIVNIVGDPTDGIVVHNDYANVNGVRTSGVSLIRFSDGSTVSPLAFDFAAPILGSFTTSGAGIVSGSGALGVGQTVTLTVTFSESVVVNTTGGTPRLTLNDGGVATYTGGSGTSALTFSHTVAAGQSTPDLAVSGLNLNGGTIKDVAGNALVESGVSSNPAGTLIIDGLAPNISSVTTSPSSGSVIAGGGVTLTVNFSESVTVNLTDGTPTLVLNDGGIATYTGGSGTTALTFSHTVATGQSAADLAVTALILNGGAIADAAGNNADLGGAVTNPAGVLVVDGILPTAGSVAVSGSSITGGSAILNAGKIVTLTVNFSENVVVNTAGGTPSLALNDGGVAIYAGGSNSNALSFAYTVAAGQNTSDLTVTALNLNGGTIKDAAGNVAVTTGAVTNPSGVLQIDTMASSVDSVMASGAGIAAGSGVLNAGKVVTLTVNFNESVIVNTTGGTPSLTLNDGGVATYAGGSGTGALTFSYTVAAGQNTSDLTVTALNLNGGTIKDAAGNGVVATGAVTNPAGILQIDTTAATVGSVATSGAGITNGSGVVGVGKVVTLTVNFSENVLVNTTGGTPSLTLNNGGVATYAGGSGSGSLTFSYTVAAGQNTADLTVTALNLNGGMIADVAGNTAVVTGAVANPTGTLVVDGTTPTVSSVTTSPASGTIIAGGVVIMTVTFSESVTVNTTGGTPTLTLNDGGVATYTGGSGTTALTFSHTVAAGQSSADLSVTAFNLNGGTIGDVAGNNAVVTGAVVNPTGTLVVDGVVPSVASIAASGSGITAGAGVLNAGKVVALTATFSEAVTVVTTGGTPTLTLNDGGVATYASGSGTTALVFNHTVASGENTPDLTVTALNLNGGTIKDSSGNPASVTGAVKNPTGILEIDTTVSTVTSVATSGPGITSGSGSLAVGKVVTLTINFNENVVVTTTGGTPTLSLNNGGVATYSAGTGTSALTFSYTIASGQSTTDLAVTALNLNGGSIKDVAGNTAVVTSAAVNPAGTLLIDGSVPSVSSVTTSPASGTVIPGGVVTLTVNFSESVTVNTSGGTPTLALNDGGVATYAGGSGTTALTFSHTVAVGQSATDLAVTALNLNGGIIADAAGNNAVLTGAAVNPTGTLLIDGIAPTVGSVATSGTGITSGTGALGVGKVVALTVTFSEAVNVVTTGGTPTLTLNDGGTATYASGSGTTALVFNHTVAAGQNTTDLAVTSLNLNGGTIKDANGNAATVAGAAVNPAGTLKIDTAGSIVTGVATSGTGITAGAGVLNAGKVVSFMLTLDEAVTVVTTGGTPSLTLNDGGTATYASGTGTSSLVFNHTVAAGQNAADLAVTAFNLNGGTIKDAVGNTAVVTGAVVNPTGTLQVDTTAPSVGSVATSGVGITAGAGVLNAGKVVTFTVNFAEAVVVTTTSGMPTLTLNDGGVATYNGGSGTSALTFGYTVAAGQNTADLTVTAFNLNSGTIKDVAGNTAVITGAVTNPAGVLQIDTTASTVSSVATSGPGITAGSGTLGVGSVLTLTVNFNEAVAVTTTGGTPTLSLNDGGIASYTGGTGSSALTFSHTVAAGQNTADLTVTAFNLNGGTVKDVAGNTAVVTGAVVNPSGTLKISTPAARMASATSQQSATADGSDRIYVLSATDNKTITPDYSAGTNEFDFTGNLTDENLWLLKAGSDLQIDIMGTTNHITLSDWFNPANQANEVITAGGLKIDSQISQLVQAMASYSGSHPGFDPTATSTFQIPNDNVLQTAVAASWHA